MAKEAKVVLVTGVGKGIGYALARALLKKGHRVVGVSRNLDAWADQPEGFLGLSIDLLEKDAISLLETHVKSLLLDAVVHNAGVLVKASLQDLRAEDLDQMMRLHVTVPALLTKVLLPRIRPGGHVVLIGSMSGFAGAKKYPGLSAYGASKAALMSFAESWAIELVDRNIQVNGLALGACETEMLRSAFPDSAKGMDADALAAWIASFVLEGNVCFNGKVLPVALADPE